MHASLQSQRVLEQIVRVILCVDHNRSNLSLSRGKYTTAHARAVSNSRVDLQECNFLIIRQHFHTLTY